MSFYVSIPNRAVAKAAWAMLTQAGYKHVHNKENFDEWYDNYIDRVPPKSLMVVKNFQGSSWVSKDALNLDQLAKKLFDVKPVAKSRSLKIGKFDVVLGENGTKILGHNQLACLNHAEMNQLIDAWNDFQAFGE